MKLFRNIIKDIAETGSPIADFRKKIVTITELLSGLSYGDSKFSEGLTKQKLLVEFNELIEIAEKCSINDEVRIYFEKTTIETNIVVASKAIQYWFDDVLGCGKRFTNTLAFALIRKAEEDINKQINPILKPKPISKAFPSYFAYMQNKKNFVFENEVLVDNSLKLEMTALYPFSNSMQQYYILEKNIMGSYILRVELETKNWGKYKKVCSDKRFKMEKDYKELQYRNIMNSFNSEMSCLAANLHKFLLNM